MESTNEMIFLAGAQKSGTGSLFKYLSQHPGCIPSNPKEPAFFSKRDNLTSLRDYWDYFDEASMGAKSYGFYLEGTTGYMVEEYVPERIYNFFGEDPKFIFLLRDPVERAISAYWHLYKQNDENRDLEKVFLNFPVVEEPEQIKKIESKQIEQALRKEKIDLASYKNLYDDIRWNFRYLFNTCYSHHLDRFLKLFPPENCLFIEFDYLVENPQACTRNVFDFIGVEYKDSSINYGVYNKTKIPMGFLRKFRVDRLLSKKLKKSLQKIGLKKHLKNFYERFFFKDKPKTQEKIREHLRDILAKQYKFLAGIDKLTKGRLLVENSVF